MDIQETLAKQLHEDFRAACKAMKIPKSPATHDHGFCDCGNRKKEYFRKRARLLIDRALNENPMTLGEAEQNLQALVFIKRRQVMEQ